MVIGHLQGLRRDPRYRESYLVLIIESNYSFVNSSYLARMAKKPEYEPVIVYSKDPKDRGRPGVWTTNQSKEVSVDVLQKLLSSDNIHFADNMVGKNLERDKKELLQQLRVFRRESKEPPNVFTERKQVLTGKVATGSNGYKKDDLCMSLLIGVSTTEDIRRDNLFIFLSNSRGLTLT